MTEATPSAEGSTPPTGGMLAGLVVLDLSGEALAYAGRLLAELGADVILVEPPGGAPERRQPPLVEGPHGSLSAPFAFLAMGKRSLTLDDATDAGRTLLDRLIGRADIVLVPDDAEAARRRGIDQATVRARNPSAIVASVTAFGMSGPRRHWQGSDLVAWAASGVAFVVGDPDRPPLGPGGGLATATSSLNATVGALVALRARQRSGRGQLVDISMQEAVLSVSMEAGPLLTLEGRIQQRSGPRRMAAHGTFPTAKGTVEVAAFLPAQWDAMADWIAEELDVQEAKLDVFKGSPMSRVPYVELINGWVDELASRYTKLDFFLEAQRRGIPTGPINSAGDLLADPQLEAIGAWQRVTHPDVEGFSMPRGPMTFDGVAPPVGAVPAPGEHTRTILVDELGLGEAEFDQLLADGVV